MRILPALLSLTCLALAPPAFAQTFPADDRWVAFPCGHGPMVDQVHDESGAIDERDLVGDRAAPAGFHAVDGQFLYLRLRVDGDPRMGAGANLRPFAWGFAFSTDALSSSYEVLIAVDGAARQVAVYRNSDTTVVDSPTDPADTPPVVTYPFATHGRAGLASGSNFGDNSDYFIDMAVRWSDLAPTGLTSDSAIVVWAASSTRPDRLDGDFACHDAGGSGSVPSLSGVASDSTTASTRTQPPGTGVSGGGAGGTGAGGASLEGGPACTCALGGPPRWTGALPILVLAIVTAMARRRARRRSGDQIPL